MLQASQLISAMMNRATVGGQKTIEFSPGQVFRGVVQKLYPENMALVQIGGLQVVAKLEASLEAGQKAWLQVQPSSGMVTLKVLTNPDAPAEVQNGSLDGLMKSLGITDPRESKTIVQELVNQNAPVSKEIVQAFTQVAKGQGVSGATVDAFMLAMKRSLPLTSDVVGALKAFLSDQPLSSKLQSFVQQIDQFLAQTGTEPEGKPVMEKAQAGSGAQPLPAQSGQVDAKQLVLQVREKLVNLPLLVGGDVSGAGGTDEQQGATNANSRQTPVQGQPSSTLPAGETVSADITQTAGKPDLALGGTVQPGRLPQDAVLHDRPANANVPQVDQLAGKATDVSGNQLPRGTEPPVGQTQADQRKTAVTHAGTVGVHNDAIDSAAKGAGQLADNADPIKAMLRQLGVMHEREIIHYAAAARGSEAFVHDGLDNVKSLLLQLSQAPAHAVPNELREAAESLLQQITGQQLMLVQPPNQLISQVVMQVPLRTEHGDETAYVQIEAKKQDGGQLDTDNCRLFFNLDLAHMGITMVDVAIVNRIINVQIFTNASWVDSFLPAAKREFSANLRDLGYQLSNLRSLPIPREPEKTATPQGKSSLMSDYKRMDIRI